MTIKIYDVTTAAIEESKDSEIVVLALFDNRYNSITIIRPVAVKDKEGIITRVKLECFDPDGADHLYWLDKFGIITEEDYQAEIDNLSLASKNKLYTMLKKEVEG